ncbi:MAG: GGDEF domain-containing protein [Pseudomonadales bacterium]
MGKKLALEIPEQEIYHFLQASKRRQLLWTIAFLGASITLLIALRMYMLGGLNSLMIGPAALLGLIVLFVAVRIGFSTQYASVMVLTIFTGLLFVLGAMSGGVNGPIIATAPFIPLLAVLIHSRTAGVVCAVSASIIVLSFALAPSFGVEFPTLHYDTQQRGIARAAFILAFIMASTLIAMHHAGLRDAMAASIWQHANKDHLTGLPNRRKIDSTLEREIGVASRYKAPLSILLMDIDNFKQYNDVNGHLKGDTCLQTIAQKLEGRIKRPEDLLGRFGGEEFIAILPDTSLEGSAKVAEDMRAAVRTLGILYEKNGCEPVTISIGIAHAYLPEHYNVERLLKLADDALYKAKDNGRNRIETAQSTGNITSITTDLAANDRRSGNFTESPSKKPVYKRS